MIVLLGSLVLRCIVAMAGSNVGLDFWKGLRVDFVPI